MQLRDSFGLPRASVITEGVVSDIHDADFVIGVLDAEASRVLFDIGFAAALQKPVLLISEPGTPVPFDIAQHRLITTSSGDSEMLKLAIRGFLKEVEDKRLHKRARRRPELQAGPRSAAAVEDALHTIQELRHRGLEQQLIRTTSQLLRAAGVTAIEELTGPQQVGADLAVWSDALSTTVGNPILIELKVGNLDQTRWSLTHEKVARVLGDTGARLGLILYLDRKGRRFTEGRQWAPLVLSFDLEDFATALVNKPFADVVLEHRNKLVHRQP